MKDTQYNSWDSVWLRCWYGRNFRLHLSSTTRPGLTLSSFFKYVGYWGISQEEEEPNESEKSTTLLVALVITFLCIFTIKEQKHNENEKDKI